MNVSVFGLGYVGCVTASCLARDGHSVIGMDVNDQKVEMINHAQSPIVEPGLGDLLTEVVESGRLSATACPREAIEASTIGMVCVGTPSRPNGQLDVEALIRAGKEIGAALRDRPKAFTLVIRSTVLPGTTEQ